MTDGGFRVLREGGMVRCCGKGGGICWRFSCTFLVKLICIFSTGCSSRLHYMKSHLAPPKANPERPDPYDITIRCGKSTRLH